MKTTKVKGKVRQLERRNQFTIENDNGIYFQSYNVIVAYIDKNDNIFIDSFYWDYSKTTTKHLCLFLGCVWSKKTIEAGIKSGEYTLFDLNK